MRTIVIPREDKPSKGRQAEERRPAFRETIKWRTGTEGARIWTGEAVLAHKLVKIGALAG